MISSNQDVTPTSLIPFCAYQTEVALVGQERTDLPFPVCSHFQPTILAGQLCYSLNISSIAKGKTKKGMKNGLVLVLSPGSQEGTEEQQTGNINKEKFKNFNFEPKKELSNLASIYLNTLASFTDFRAGSFAMSVLKRMRGTDSFLGLPDEEKNCQIETFEDCQTRGYVREVLAQCGCVPWALSSALSLKDPIFCSPRDSPCYTAVSSNITGCRVSCTGLYADVQFTEDKILAKDVIGDLTAKGNYQNHVEISLFFFFQFSQLKLFTKKKTGTSCFHSWPNTRNSRATMQRTSNLTPTTKT